MAQTQLTREQQLSKPRQPITLEAYLELPGEFGYEVIDGELIPMSPQILKSSRVEHVLYNSLHMFVSKKKPGIVWMQTAYALEVSGRKKWLKGALVPDIAFMSNERYQQQIEKHGEEGPMFVAPDLAVEVVSPSDRFSLITKKVARYLQYGVRLVWVIDPENRVIYVYTPNQPDGRALHENDTLTGAPVLPEWSLSVRELLDAKPDL